VRIAFDATAMPMNRAGAGNYIFFLVQALSEVDRVNQYLIFAKPEHLEAFGIVQDNFELIGIAQPSVPRRLLWEQAGLPGELRRRRVDLLHSPHYTMPLRKVCKSVVSFPDMIFIMMPQVHGRGRRTFFQMMMRWSARHADRLIAISESTRQDLFLRLHVPLDQIVTTVLAASESYRPLPKDETQSVCDRYGLTPGRYVYYVGVLEPRKNVPVLLEAYAKLAAEFPNVPLVIAGKKGWMYESIFQQAKALGLEDRVRFLGYVPDADLAALYNGARVFVYPSQYEGFGLPVLEAMQCGTPTITTDISSMPEVAGDAALLVAPNDATALADALKRLLTDDALAQDLSQRGIERAKLFSWQRCARETLAVYQSVYEATR
jgi:glycosyltransferase involved in cell wall biosynthesis